MRVQGRIVRLGFTLVELLVVIGIIAVLIAMLLPSLNRAREQANLIKCMSGARQVFFSLEMYCNDNKDFYPTRPQNTSLPIWQRIADPNGYTWVKQLIDGKYLNGQLQTNRGGCPYGPNPWDATPAFQFDYWPLDSNGGDYYTVTTDPRSVCYGFNGRLQSGFGYRNPPINGNYYGYWNNWKRSSPWLRRNFTRVGLVFCSPAPWTIGTQDIYPSLWYAAGLSNAYGPPRHLAKALPVACADGHVETLRPEEIYSGSVSASVPVGTTIFYYSTYWLLFAPP